MDTEALEHHLTSPQGQGHTPVGAHTVTAEGGSCGDRVRMSLATDGERVTDAGFLADGCGTLTAAASVAVSLVRGVGLLAAARIGAREIAAELGGLSAGKFHAAEVAADALARALGACVTRAGALPAPAEGARTLVAMSGGVDSAVAATLCQDVGETVAVTLELWADRDHDAERSCCSASAVAVARRLAHDLGLPHVTVDLRDAFRAGVVTPFIAAYQAGETPNPCVRCNGEVRIDAMVDLADRIGAHRLATGHYARLSEDGLLRRAADPAKDQTYMLAGVSPATLARLHFPLGELTKPEVRAIAAARGLSVAQKPDSQDLCFLAGTDRASFLARHGGRRPRPGEIVAVDGRVLGSHAGQELFTVGQRRGFGDVRGVDGEPLYVLARDAASNRLTVGARRDLMVSGVRLRDTRLHAPSDRVNQVKLRYRSTPIPARLEAAGPGRHASLTLELDEPVAGVAPGQLAALLDGEVIIGWGAIAPPPRAPAAPAAARGTRAG
ncbi:tRNA 2-thiouridine(34) synthase MnmA [Conexibacter sp. DBS9H8]|uniref:tRNA 2-thiouridine(34) synthase MnmA n=1 Tax=Conexibacter sp. DBS9H8 TaxID=2937801 RepID=UPI00200F3BE4|nr:tRNA 2-thiouridine(34) synthase MnmA [Conexibacter sp. DBS9H8]